MSLQIGPDVGDTIVVDDQGVRITVTYPFKDDTTDPDTGEFLFNNGEKTTFSAQFPRDFSELSLSDGSLESALMTLATQVARRTGVHS